MPRNCPIELNGKQSITPVEKPLLLKYLIGVPGKYGLNYQKSVVMIGYLQQNTRPKISMANYQCACFLNKPMRSNKRAIIRISHYLQNTTNRGIIFHPDPKIGIECFVDAYSAGC